MPRLAIILLIFVFASLGQPSYSLSEKGLVGQPVLPFAATGQKGEKMDTALCKGKVLILHFWIIWGNGLDDVPVLRSLYHVFKDQGLEIYGIPAVGGPGSGGKFMQVMNEQNVEWPQYFSGHGIHNFVSKMYRVKTMPHIVLVDKKGIVAGENLASAQLPEMVVRLLSDAPVEREKMRSAYKKDRVLCLETRPDAKGVPDILEKARIYDNGEMSAMDKATALGYYREAADKGNVDAMLALAGDLNSGRLGKKNFKEALGYVSRAARSGSTAALTALAGMVASGTGTPKDPEAAMRYYREAAEKGKAADWTALGDIYMADDVVPRDYAKAMDCYERARLLEDSSATLKLSRMYERGLGVKADKKQALELVLNAAAKKEPAIWVKIGDIYCDGRLTDRNYGRAADWYQKAADKGNSQAVLKLAEMRLEGLGAAQDLAGALNLHEKAARAGDPGIMFLLGTRLKQGVFGAPDPVAGITWLERAAENNSGPAALALCEMYKRGDGVPRDMERARACFDIASSRGLPAMSAEDKASGEAYFKAVKMLVPARTAARDPAASKKTQPSIFNGRGGWYYDARQKDAFLNLTATGKDGLPLRAWGHEKELIDGSQSLGPLWFKGRAAIILCQAEAVDITRGLAGFQSAAALDIFGTPDKTVAGTPDQAAAIKARLSLVKDQRFLYIGAQVWQSRGPLNEQDAWNLGAGDSLEVMISVRPGLTGQSRPFMSPSDHRLVFAPVSRLGRPLCDQSFNPDFKDLRLFSRATDSGYILAAAVPLSALKDVDWTAGKRLRFDAAVNKAASDGAGRECKVFWNASFDAVENPDGWGIAEIR